MTFSFRVTILATVLRYLEEMMVVVDQKSTNCSLLNLMFDFLSHPSLQVDTDESLLLGSRQVHSYSWRTPHTVKASPRLHVCIETEGDWRWSEPFDIDTVGVFGRTIHHRLHSATLFIEVKQLSGMQKQVSLHEILISRLLTLFGTLATHVFFYNFVYIFTDHHSWKPYYRQSLVNRC